MPPGLAGGPDHIGLQDGNSLALKGASEGGSICGPWAEGRDPGPGHWLHWGLRKPPTPQLGAWALVSASVWKTRGPPELQACWGWGKSFLALCPGPAAPPLKRLAYLLDTQRGEVSSHPILVPGLLPAYNPLWLPITLLIKFEGSLIPLLLLSDWGYSSTELLPPVLSCHLGLSSHVFPQRSPRPRPYQHWPLPTGFLPMHPSATPQ